jgi:FkbM family methyltransferase
VNFVSYAQNFEDVILWRALHDVHDGRYIDIGAQEPEFDSVSYAFYKAGWRGIHVEPTPSYAARLREARPDETVIEAAVSDAPGPIPFFELGGLSTGREDVAEHHRRSGHQSRTIMVPTVRLDELLTLTKGDLHWLKIDVEGMEADVLRSWGTSSRRPWVLVVESTFPNSQETTERLWIHEVVSRGYKETFFDGLSRYFVHESHLAIAERLNRPANVFDDFQITSQHFAAALTRDEAEAQRKVFEARIAALSLDILQVRDRLQARESEFAGERARRQRSADEAEKLRSRLHSAEAELAVERAKVGELDELQRQSGAEIDRVVSNWAEVNAELLRISRLTAGESDELIKPDGKDQALPFGATYTAVKSRLAMAKEELHVAREFAVQQFVAGQISRDPEVNFLRERVSGLQSEIVEVQRRLDETEARAPRERAHLQSMINEQAQVLSLMKADSAELDRQLIQAQQCLSAIYQSRRGKLACWLRLVPARPRSAGVALNSGAGSAPRIDTQESEQTSEMTQYIGMDISVNDVRHTSNLLALNGSAFVDALYRTFLKRSADRAGRDHFIARLQAGDAKEEILLAIANSPEAQSAGTKIDGLADLERAQARAGRWSLFKRDHSRQVLNVRFNRLEYNIGEVHCSLINRLERMESSLEQIQANLESSGSAREIPAAREAGVYVQGVPVSIKRNLSIRPTNGAAEFIEQLREGVQSSMEALSLRNGR